MPEIISSASLKTATCPATWDLIEQLVQLESSKNRLHLEYMGRAMPAHVYLRFQNLRDERIPALRSQLRLGLAAAPDQPPAHFAHAYADQLMLRCMVPVEPGPHAAPTAVAEALAQLEGACEKRAALTTTEVYNSLAELPGMSIALLELDVARGQARAALAATPALPATEDSSAGDQEYDALRCAVGNCTFNGEVAQHAVDCQQSMLPAQAAVQADPVAVLKGAPYEPTSAMLIEARRLEPALPFDAIRAIWWAMWRKAPQAEPVADWLPYSRRVALAARHGQKVTGPFNALVRDVIATYLDTHGAIAPQAQPADALTKAALDVLAERARQIGAEGWTQERDDSYSECELALAAASYACAAAGYAKAKVPPLWPWSLEWWKPTYGRRDLEKAGALILAEMERFDRAAMAAAQEGGKA